MEVPKVHRVERGSMEDMQPSSSSENDSARQGMNGSEHAVNNSQEIQSVAYGVGRSDQNVDTGFIRGEVFSPQLSDTGQLFPGDQDYGKAERERLEADSCQDKESLGAPRTGRTDEARSVSNPICRDEIPTSVPIAEVGSPQHRAIMCPAETPPVPKKSDSHVVDVRVKDSVKVQELDGYKAFTIARTTSNFSVESSGELCRICQQYSDEPVMELGCHCRGELAKAHRSCIEQWFGNKGTNKCEVCQHVATNVPAPSSQPTPHFWVWRVGGGTYNNGGAQRRAGGARFHPLWAALLILIAGLLFDVLISIFLGASALPVNIIIGVLVVLGLGTAARLVLECWHERAIRRNIRRMEEEPNTEEFSADESTIDIHTQPLQPAPDLPVPVSPQTLVTQGAEAGTRASSGATT